MPPIKSTKDLVWYEWKRVRGNSTVMSSLRGRKGVRDGYMYRNIGMNQFENEETKIPKNYVKMPLKLWHVKEFWWDPEKTQIVREKPTEHMVGKTTFTHDNGGRPFLVYYNDAAVSVFRIPTNRYVNVDSDWDDNEWMYQERLMTFKNPVKTWLGQDYTEGWHGNSVLVQVSKRKYVYVGDSIYSFQSHQPIIAYYSNVGNNDVPYPVALTEKRAYFMLDKVWVDRDDFSLTTPQQWADSYSQFYGHIEGMKSNAEKHPMTREKELVKRD